MKLFKEAEIKKMIGYVTSEQMSFSRFVEILNEKVYKDKAEKGELTSYMDVIRCIEQFLTQNENCKSVIKVRLQDMKAKLMEEVLNDLMNT